MQFPLPAAFGFLGLVPYILGGPQSKLAQAQVLPELGLGTHVTSQTAQDFTITGGTLRGEVLFHGFAQFDIPTAGSVRFDLENQAVSTLVGRVSGGKLSQVDGLLTMDNALGNVDVFLLNPSGIQFGPNARLDLPGSFVATTATAVQFDEGGFAATADSAVPLLTVSTPTGLQFGDQSGNIAVQGMGHALSQMTLLGPIYETAKVEGLQVQPSRSLLLLGSSVDLQGGVLSAEQGRIELGAIAGPRTVNLELTDTGWQNHYSVQDQAVSGIVGRQETALPAGTIRLAGRSLLNLTGATAGSAKLAGQNIELTDASLIWGQSRGFQAGPTGQIALIADDTIRIVGTDEDVVVRSGVLYETLGAIRSGDIDLQSKNLLLLNGAAINSLGYSLAGTGNITANVSDLLQIEGVAPKDFRIGSVLGIGSLLGGTVGNVEIDASQIRLLEGGVISALNAGEAMGGEIEIKADAIEVSGRIPESNLPSSISVTTFGKGDGGDIRIETGSLQIQNRGNIASSASAEGNGGVIVIQARDFVEILEPSQENFSASITASTSADFGLIRDLIRLPDRPSGNAGSVSISAPIVRLDGGVISVQANGSGDAGDVQLSGNELLIRDNSRVQAQTRQGSGGNINLDFESLLLAQRDSLISAGAGGLGDGGNISIRSPLVLAIENSDIVADAVDGDGGVIAIRSQALFGAKSRSLQTKESDITANSQSGNAGEVAISTFDESITGVQQSVPMLVTSETVSLTRCVNEDEDQFVVSGTGGLPSSPVNNLATVVLWQDGRGDLGSVEALEVEPLRGLQEAGAILKLGETGQVQLVAREVAVQQRGVAASVACHH